MLKQTIQKVDSSLNAPSSRASEAPFLSSRADEIGVAIHNQKVDSSVKVDCHDFAAAKQAKRSFFRKSRNDKVVDRRAAATAQYDNNPL